MPDKRGAAVRVELAFRRVALERFPPRSSVLVGVSGGGDSVGLLHLLVRLAERRPLAVGVAHLDHALRRGSGADRRFVERLASDLDLPVLSDRRPVKTLRRKGESLEEAARRVRRGFLLEAAESAGAAAIALGHTLDDQAETVLLRLVRGAGPSALAGMSVAGPGPFVRPLLAIPRRELRAFLAHRRIRFREDPSNRDLRFDRNRLRVEILPLIERTLNPKAALHLVQAAERLRADSELLDARARRAFRRIAHDEPGGRWSIAAGALSRQPAPVALRIARLALERAGVDPRRVSARHVEGLLGLADGASGRGLDLPGGRSVKRRGDRLVFS